MTPVRKLATVERKHYKLIIRIINFIHNRPDVAVITIHRYANPMPLILYINYTRGNGKTLKSTFYKLNFSGSMRTHQAQFIYSLSCINNQFSNWLGGVTLFLTNISTVGHFLFLPPLGLDLNCSSASSKSPCTKEISMSILVQRLSYHFIRNFLNH